MKFLYFYEKKHDYLRMAPSPFLQELEQKEKRQYTFREQTLLWRDTDGEYKIYVSVILEATAGWNRFDYSAFDYGSLSPDPETDVVVHQTRQCPKEIPLSHNTYIIDYDVWETVNYFTGKKKLKQVF